MTVFYVIHWSQVGKHIYCSKRDTSKGGIATNMQNFKLSGNGT